MGQAPSGVKSDPTTRETSVAGVYVAGDAGNAVQSALLAAASGASAAFFVNHSLVAEEIAAAVGAAGSAAVRRGLRLSGPTRRR
jgi:pyruvate/2-oxoglutarate dehydrogenase complex dihydrolipoamide dehydrogenase (E3) component